jgi:hypothetical protein
LTAARATPIPPNPPPESCGSLCRVCHYAKYRQLAGSALPPGTTLQDAAIKCDWEYELTIICTKLLPDDMKLEARVVVEGTPLFDRLMNELITGIIWAQAAEV